MAGENRFKHPVNVQNVLKDGSTPLSFLLAGVGNGALGSLFSFDVDLTYLPIARHAFGTLVGLAKAQGNLRPQQRKDLKAHLTLLDIHFATIARDLLLCMFLHTLAEEQLDADARLELQASLVYIYVGWAMPDYCSER
jgi:hypothetical protein